MVHYGKVLPQEPASLVQRLYKVLEDGEGDDVLGGHRHPQGVNTVGSGLTVLLVHGSSPRPYSLDILEEESDYVRSC
jgi:hypothetical protein